MADKHVLITGGAGFIGSNAAAYFLQQGSHVTIFDNFSRKGSKKNLVWLKKLPHANRLLIIRGDVRRPTPTLNREIQKTNLVLHLAGQVAVTTSIQNPVADFDANAFGTLSMLEAVRKHGNNPIFIYSSTNKVYGGLEHTQTKETKTRYSFTGLRFGVNEKQALDFHSPYGCSKGSADQYVRDYHRIYGMNTIVFRQSCIYGPHQFGIEDQGWLAWFMISILQKKPLTIYGTGKQVRDVLYIDDLIRAYDLAAQHIKKTKGEIYNIGGGMNNTISVWHEFRPILEKLCKKPLSAKFSAQRLGDQPVYISDIRKAAKDFGWRPTISFKKGIPVLYAWIVEHQDQFRNL